MSVDGGMAASGSLKLPISTETSEETELKTLFCLSSNFLWWSSWTGLWIHLCYSPPDCKYISGQQNLLYSLCKWHNQCRTEGLLSECWLTLKRSGRASHSLCRTERLFMLTPWPSICGKAGLLETSGTSSVKTTQHGVLQDSPHRARWHILLSEDRVWNHINELLEEK